MGEVYIIGRLEGHYKIGRSKDAESRMMSYTPKLPVQLSIVHRISTPDEVWLEGVIHAAMHHRRGLGEWFRLTESDLEMLQNIHHINTEADLPAVIVDNYRKRIAARPLAPSVSAKLGIEPVVQLPFVPKKPGEGDGQVCVYPGCSFTIAPRKLGEGLFFVPVKNDNLSHRAIMKNDKLIMRRQDMPIDGGLAIVAINQVVSLYECEQTLRNGEFVWWIYPVNKNGRPVPFGDHCEVLGVAVMCKNAIYPDDMACYWLNTGSSQLPLESPRCYYQPERPERMGKWSPGAKHANGSDRGTPVRTKAFVDQN